MSDAEKARTEGTRGPLTEDDVQWVVNDIAELGVKIGNQFFFLYKGHSLVYGEADDPEVKDGICVHENGTPMHWRPVFKREFGECCHPVNYKDPRMIGTVSLDDSDEWKPLPAATSPSAITRNIDHYRDNQVNAWLAVATLMDEICPRWHDGEGSEQEKMIQVLRNLVASSATALAPDEGLARHWHREAEHLKKEVARKQAHIDRLMLEYCPEEMTTEQIEEWRKHQCAVTPEQEAQLALAVRAQTGGGNG